MRPPARRGNHRATGYGHAAAQLPLAYRATAAIPCAVERNQNAARQQCKGHAKRNTRMDLDIQPMEQDLAANEDQHQGQGVLEIDEPVHQRGKGKIQRTQTQNGEDVRGIDDEGILSDGKDRRHAVHGKHQISQLDQHQRQKQRSGKQLDLAGPVRQAHEEVRAMQFIGHPEALADKAHHGILREVLMLLLILAEEHLHPGEQQEYAEDIQNPLELLHQRRTKTDHDGAQHYHSENAPKQHAVLIKTRNTEEAENHRHDEDVVHRQGLLDQETGIELQPAGRPPVEPDPQTEKHADGEIAAVQQQTLAHLDLVLITVQHAEVKSENTQHYGQESEPLPGGSAKKRCG